MRHKWVSQGVKEKTEVTAPIQAITTAYKHSQLINATHPIMKKKTSQHTKSFCTPHESSKGKLIANALIFQVLWFICVQGNNLAALLATIVVVSIHWYAFSRRLSEWSLIIIFIFIGIIWESIVASTSLIRFSSSMLFGSTSSPIAIAPLWLTCLWAGFAMTLRHSMAWLAKSALLRLALCVVFVPVSYYGGAVFSQSQFPNGPIVGLFAESVAWCVLLHFTYRNNK